MQGLHNARMLSLKSLEEAHIIQLIDLLISEKKWIQENTSSTFPFTLSIPSDSTSSTTSQENLPQCVTNPDQLSIKKLPPKKIMLSDFRKVVKELLDEQPEGFQIGYIKPTFESKFGYMLEYRKLGYRKLVSLLQTIPDIKIVGKNKVCKFDKEKKKIEADNIGNDVVDSNEEDSVFDELGPISVLMTHEPSLSGEEFSDEPETKASTDFNGETTKEQSSLTEIVDTFASTKDEDAMSKEPLGIDEIVDCARRHDINKSELWLGDSVRKPRPLRSQKGQYKFVADEVEDEKEKIVNSILGTLKKNGHSNIMGGGKGI